ncbi:tetratricopeptide repeat protein [Hymenobacter weizhouensis]|uniref:hypothetical protein n=1 Tax=Hymenobacter sp. YIM 151500-1 TaxID=2987689 RepID=UPI00222700AA|nr:hypothetical protein [Hymenobacter sp. YIM 151500-1]UYZ62568.1 hypothetical protein OIS53_16400 [Hymenobacter sp. YIM 151500-1]
MKLKSSFLLLAAALLLTAAPAQAQRKAKNQSAPAAASAASRLQPLFGGLSPEQAAQVVGAKFLADIERSFASRAEASRFFSIKGYEYLQENQPDTAAYRFNLAWVLDPKNPDAYRGLGIVVSSRPGGTDEAISLLSRGLALDPKNALLLSDLGASHLIRYDQSKKKKDLTTATTLLGQAVAQDATNAVAWGQLARAQYLQEQYAQAWESVHKAQAISMAAIDFGLLTELMAKLPDPQGKFK